MGSASTRLVIRAAPGKSRMSVRGRYGDGWKVDVSAAAERGRANDALCAWLAGLLGVDRSAVRIVSGAGGRDKLVEIHGCTAGQVDAALESAVV